MYYTDREIYKCTIFISPCPSTAAEPSSSFEYYYYPTSFFCFLLTAACLPALQVRVADRDPATSVDLHAVQRHASSSRHPKARNEEKKGVSRVGEEKAGERVSPPRAPSPGSTCQGRQSGQLRVIVITAVKIDARSARCLRYI